MASFSSFIVINLSTSTVNVTRRNIAKPPNTPANKTVYQHVGKNRDAADSGGSDISGVFKMQQLLPGSCNQQFRESQPTALYTPLLITTTVQSAADKRF